MTTMQMVVLVAGVILTGSCSFVIGACWQYTQTRNWMADNPCDWEIHTELPGPRPGTKVAQFQTGCKRFYTVVQQPGSNGTYHMRFCPYCGKITKPKGETIGLEKGSKAKKQGCKNSC